MKNLTCRRCHENVEVTIIDGPDGRIFCYPVEHEDGDGWPCTGSEQLVREQDLS